MTTPPPSPPFTYADPSFLDSDEARPLRILTEYLGPLRRFKQATVHDTIVFFGSARLAADGPLGRYYEGARELARSADGVVQEPVCPHAIVTWSVRAAAAASWKPPTAARRRPAEEASG